MSYPSERTGRWVHCGQPMLAALSLAMLGVLAGCQDTRKALDPFNIFSEERPVRIGTTKLDLAPPLFMPRWFLFHQALAGQIDAPLQMELMTPRQIQVHLGTGRLQFALLGPEDYARLEPTGTWEILAVALHSQGQEFRTGLIVVPAASSVQALTEVRSLRFHSLPFGDLLNEAALGALLEVGVGETEIDRGQLQLGLLNTHLNSYEVVKSVVIERKAAGVIDEADYAKWPVRDGSLLLFNPSQDMVKVVGRTVPVPAGFLVVSKQADPELRRKVEHFVLEVAPKRHGLALLSLGCKGFVKPRDPQGYEAFGQMYRRLRPTDTRPAVEGDDPASVPAGEGESDREQPVAVEGLATSTSASE